MASSMLFCNHFKSILSTPPLDYLSRLNTRKIPISSNKTFSSKLVTRLKCSPVSVSNLDVDSLEEELIKQEEEFIKKEEEFIKQEEELIIKHEEELIKQKKEFIKQEEELIIKHEEEVIIKQEEELIKHEEEVIIKQEEELIKHEEEVIKQEEELIIKQEDKRPLQDMWREIQGCNNWEGLLDPMSSTLRNEIIRYGEFAQVCYDAFDFDPYSKYCGTCKYESSQFFEKLEMENLGYQMRRYLYATSNINLPNFFQHSKITSVWSKHANWMGYVAVAADEEEIKRLGRRDIVVAWRGTVTYLEWIHDLKDILHPAYFCDDPKIKIESGFFDLYTAKEHSCRYASYSAREQILAEIRRLVEKYKNEKLSITITGHSLGAALALLSAYDIAEMKLNVKQGTDGASDDTIPITVFSFSGPRVGNLKFKERCDELNIKVLRVHNVHDKVPTVPGIIANEKLKYQKYVEEVMAFPWSYAHVGTELAFDHKKSPFLRSTNDFGCLHNLEALLHLVDGYHGEGKEFRSVNKRDIALVNKCCNFLREEYDVPPHWRQDENKGMVRNKDGKWVLPERPMEAHPPDTDHHLKYVLKIAELPSSQDSPNLT